MIFEGTKNQFFFGLELTRAGRGVPDISLLEPLAEELHVSVTELLNGEEQVQEEAVHDTKAHMADIDLSLIHI